MWPLFNNQSEQVSDARRPMKFVDIIQSIGDFKDFEHNDSALKFWLPEAAEIALNELCSRNGDSLSDFIRKFFIIHSYGLYAYYVINDQLENLFELDGNEPAVFCASRGSEYQAKRDITYWIPELGKNVAPIKVWIPQRLKEDLQKLADHTAIKLSQYAREIVISRLLGYGMLPMRPEMLTAQPGVNMERWCDDLEVEMHQVSHAEYLINPIVETRID